MSIKLVNVYLYQKSQKVKVGRLAYENRQIYFEYEKDFLQTGIELSPFKLPTTQGVKQCEDSVFDDYLECLQIRFQMDGESF